MNQFYKVEELADYLYCPERWKKNYTNYERHDRNSLNREITRLEELKKQFHDPVLWELVRKLRQPEYKMIVGLAGLLIFIVVWTLTSFMISLTLMLLTIASGFIYYHYAKNQLQYRIKQSYEEMKSGKVRLVHPELHIYDDDFELEFDDINSICSVYLRCPEKLPVYVHFGFPHHIIKLAAQMKIIQENLFTYKQVKGYLVYKGRSPKSLQLKENVDRLLRQTILGVSQKRIPVRKKQIAPLYRCEECPFCTDCQLKRKEESHAFRID